MDLNNIQNHIVIVEWYLTKQRNDNLLYIF